MMKVAKLAVVVSVVLLMPHRSFAEYGSLGAGSVGSFTDYTKNQSSVSKAIDKSRNPYPFDYKNDKFKLTEKDKQLLGEPEAITKLEDEIGELNAELGKAQTDNYLLGAAQKAALEDRKEQLTLLLNAARNLPGGTQGVPLQSAENQNACPGNFSKLDNWIQFAKSAGSDAQGVIEKLAAIQAERSSEESEREQLASLEQAIRNEMYGKDKKGSYDKEKAQPDLRDPKQRHIALKNKKDELTAQKDDMRTQFYKGLLQLVQDVSKANKNDKVIDAKLNRELHGVLGDMEKNLELSMRDTAQIARLHNACIKLNQRLGVGTINPSNPNPNASTEAGQWLMEQFRYYNLWAAQFANPNDPSAAQPAAQAAGTSQQQVVQTATHWLEQSKCPANPTQNIQGALARAIALVKKAKQAPTSLATLQGLDAALKAIDSDEPQLAQLNTLVARCDTAARVSDGFKKGSETLKPQNDSTEQRLGAQSQALQAQQAQDAALRAAIAPLMFHE